ncbi:hypothetical protein HZH66_001296 [Vespula vulgaris]|uniref:Uncharacterized protein n=1 Tax=Vespula vulgaris TaxID=7454 RepID=A0A834NKH9_VESVU|nr:hypothetical protein HZH66_001296 [Vespula vulgaris]
MLTPITNFTKLFEGGTVVSRIKESSRTRNAISCEAPQRWYWTGTGKMERRGRVKKRLDSSLLDLSKERSEITGLKSFGSSSTSHATSWNSTVKDETGQRILWIDLRKERTEKRRRMEGERERNEGKIEATMASKFSRYGEPVDDDQVERNERDEGPKGVRSPALKRKRFFPSLNPSLYLTFLIPQASIPAAPLRSYSDSQRSQVTVQRESMRIPNGPVLEFHCRATLLFAMTPQSQYSRRFTDVSNYASDGTLIIFILYKRWRTDSFPSSTFSLIEQSP